MIIGIVAIARNFAIGKNGKLPWHHPGDLKFFKETTLGSAIVMGSTTWKSIGKPLPGRLNIILTRSGCVSAPDNVLELKSKDQVIEISRYLDRDLFIIGGAKVFASFADLIERWIVTTVPDEVTDADTFMPHDFLGGFEIEETRDLGEGLQVKILRRKAI